MKELIITNGDSAVQIMRSAGIAADILPWRDVLHDGPVPAHIDNLALSRVRASFIADQGWGDKTRVLRGFAERDAKLAEFAKYRKVTLWFEHDLYDQLQILQILDTLAGQNLSGVKLRVICTDQYLGYCSPDQMLGLRRYEEKLEQAHFQLARKAWHAFRQPSPIAWRALLDEDTSALPFLKHAVLRQLQEYPSCRSGLSRSEIQALRVISDGVRESMRVFGEWSKLEERRFMGDLSFFNMLNRLVEANPPLLRLSEGRCVDFRLYPDQTLNITPYANAVITDSQSALNAMKFDYWIGGVHLRPDNIWCWDDKNQTLHSGRPDELG